jgi:transposase
MSEQPTIHTERVDDVPLLLAQLERMGVSPLLDAHFPAHGNRRGLSLGGVCAIWLSHILSRADHRLNQVRAWADQLPTTLASFVPAPLRPTDLTDDRLADVLRALSDDTRWAAYEGALNGQLLRVYDLHPTTVRVDSTTASGYWEVTEDGLFQFGHSKDHRPDLPQVKVMLATLDPLGMPLAADVVPGQRTDDPRYLPTIARVRASLGRTGLLYIGDCKLGTVGNRAGVHRAGDHYLCPLSAVQISPAMLAALVEAALAEAALATPATLPTVTRLGDHGKPIVIATGTEDTVTMTAMVDDEPVTWVERRLLVRSQAHAAAQARGLWRRVEQAEVDLSDLLVARRGKVRPLTPTDLETAVAAILSAQQVTGLLTVTTEATAHTRTIRPYRGQPAREETTYDLALTTTRNREAITAAEARLGWRVDATNRPADQLSLAQAVLAYREEYLVEHSLGRLKGAPLSLRPVYLSRDDHTTGLIRLLTIGVRVLTVREYAIRQRLADTPARVSGLYASQPNRATARPTTERVLEAFRNLTLTVVHLPGQIFRHLTPLSALQHRLLALAGLDPICYGRLTTHSSEPPG